MNWDSLVKAASETVIGTFGQRALVDSYLWCTVVIDVIPRSSGSAYESITEDYPVAIFSRSEVESEDEGLEVGMQIDTADGNSYVIEAVCDERTNKHHVAYWVKKVDE